MKRTKTIVVGLDRADVYRGPLILVNREHPIHLDIEESRLTRVASDICLEKQAARLYETVMESVGGTGQIVPVSGHRPRAEQEKLYTEALDEHGEAYTQTYVALPGCSEHQTGLALDVGLAGPEIDFITPSFPYEGICQRFRRAAVEHGFIQRYPEGKQDITGIGHEPWHFRYVGVPHAQVMSERSLTLEEYILWLRDFPWEGRPWHYVARGRAYEIGYVPAGPKGAEIALHGEPYTISGDNVGGFVVTVWGCET